MEVFELDLLYTNTHTHIYPSNAFDMFHKISMGFGVFWYKISLYQYYYLVFRLLGYIHN
jgi:hypothetical protein